MAKVALINSSVQKKNYTAFTLNIVKDELIKNNIDVTEIRLKEFNLPFPGEDIEDDNSKYLRELLSSSDAFIIGSPEYNGSFTAKLKLMIENSGFPSVLKGKPIGLIGLASGVLGAIKSLEQLRTVFSHIGGFVLPRAVSISNIENRFDDKGNCVDKGTQKEIRLAAKKLIEFLKLIQKN